MNNRELMKTVRIKSPGGYENIAFVDTETRTLEEREILVKWHATSLNYHDLMVAKGLIPVEDGRIPMSDGAGEVVDIGPKVTKWKTGDKVMSLFFPKWDTGKPTLEKTRGISGETVEGYATSSSILDEGQVSKMPENYSYGQAATLPCAALTAWRALMVEGKLKAGETVLVEGTGGMSIFALQLAKAAGAKVYATTSSPNKVDKLKELGADVIYNYKEDPKWGKSIYKHSNGGIDHVIDVGGGATMRGSIDAVKMYGNIYSIGILGGAKGEILYPKLFFKHIHLIGLAVGSREMQEDMVNAIEANHLLPIIDRTFSLEDLSQAFRYQESGKHFGKIVVEW